MKNETRTLWFQLAVLVLALLQSRGAFFYELDDGVTFRAKTSYIEHRFNTTSAFPGVYFSLDFSSTSCKADLLSVTSRDTAQFYRISLEKENRVTFYYKLEDEELHLPVLLPDNRTFCNGEKHRIEFSRYGKIFTSKADNGLRKSKKETGIKRTVIFSKPDKIVLGGISNNKFDGCIYGAIVVFYWKSDSTNISLNLIDQYLKGDSKVRSADVFTGACPGTRAGGNYTVECTRHKNRSDVIAGHGMIASPRVTESRHISRCKWFITAPSMHRLKLTVLFYNVSEFVPCFESQVVVFDGKTSDTDVRERFCYAKSNTVIYTRGNHMVVDMRLPKNGYLDFIAVYEAVGRHEGPCPTNRTLSGVLGTLMSPNFPNNYETDHECSWLISVPIGYHVLLSFNPTDFVIHPCNETCDCDFLEVREGRSPKGKLLGKYCGNKAPSPIYTSGRYLWLRFVSNKVTNNKGFRANFEAVGDFSDSCPWNKTFTAHRGFIHSPRFALNYPGKMECIWRIHVSNKHKVAFVFLGPLNFDPNCTDVLEIRDGLYTSSPLLNRYCASAAAPAKISSSGRDMLVRFKSDGYILREMLESGFQATYFAIPVKSGAAIPRRDISALTLAVLYLYLA